MCFISMTTSLYW